MEMQLWKNPFGCLPVTIGSQGLFLKKKKKERKMNENMYSANMLYVPTARGH